MIIVTGIIIVSRLLSLKMLLFLLIEVFNRSHENVWLLKLSWLKIYLNVNIWINRVTWRIALKLLQKNLILQLAIFLEFLRVNNLLSRMISNIFLAFITAASFVKQFSVGIWFLNLTSFESTTNTTILFTRVKWSLSVWKFNRRMNWIQYSMRL